MSDNSQLVVIRNTNSPLPFEVHHNHCIDNDFTPSEETLLKSFKLLQEASKWSEQYVLNESVEYGVYISNDCWLELDKEITNPVQILVNHGFKKMLDEEVCGMASKDYFYLIDNNGDTHYFMNKELSGEVKQNDD